MNTTKTFLPFVMDASFLKTLHSSEYVRSSDVLAMIGQVQNPEDKVKIDEEINKLMVQAFHAGRNLKSYLARVLLESGNIFTTADVIEYISMYALVQNMKLDAVDKRKSSPPEALQLIELLSNGDMGKEVRERCTKLFNMDKRHQEDLIMAASKQLSLIAYKNGLDESSLLEIVGGFYLIHGFIDSERDKRIAVSLTKKLAAKEITNLTELSHAMS